METVVTAPTTSSETKTTQHGRTTFLPFHQPSIDESEIQSVTDVLRSGWLTMGRKTFEFEEMFALRVGAKYAIAVNSCTAGLHLALDALGIGAGDEILTSVYTFTSTAAVATHLGAVPVLVDVSPDTFNLDPEQLERKITPRTRAIVPVHLAGIPCPMDEVLDIAARHDLRVIEDAAHALPARYKGRMIGAIGDITAFSFYATKNMTTGEGGMVTTDRPEWAERMRARRLHGITRDAWKRYSSEGSWFYEVNYPGYKCNMTDVAAALGLQQLRKLDRFHGTRTYYAGLYRTGLGDLPELTLPETPPWAEHAWHLYILQLNLERLTINRDQFIEALRERQIGTSVHFIPLHLHPYYRDTFGYRPEDFPCALSAYERSVSLPLYPRMTEADVWDVIRAVRDIVERHRVRRTA